MHILLECWQQFTYAFSYDLLSSIVKYFIEIFRNILDDELFVHFNSCYEAS